MDINTDNTLMMRVVVDPESPPEYKQYYYRSKKDDFAIQLYKAMESLTSPIVVSIDERPLTRQEDWFGGWEFRATLYKVHHEHLIVSHLSNNYQPVLRDFSVRPKRFYDPIVKFIRNMVKSIR